MIARADRSKKSLEEKEEAFQAEEGKLDGEFLLSKRMLDDAEKSLKEAIEKSDMIGVKVAHEMLSSAREKMKTMGDLREKQKKEQEVLGKKRKHTINSMFTKIKETCAAKALSKVRRVDEQLLKNDAVSIDGDIEIKNVSAANSLKGIPGSSKEKEVSTGEKKKNCENLKLSPKKRKLEVNSQKNLTEAKETKKDKGESSLKKKKQKRIDWKDEADTKKIVSTEKGNSIDLGNLDQNNNDREPGNFTLGIFTTKNKSKEKKSKNNVTKKDLSKKSHVFLTENSDAR